MTEALKQSIDALPEKPGCYQYFNSEGHIIYVGKAKNLKRRVSSYFNKEQDSAKTRILVRNIDSLQYIVVNSEHEALLLENNLIKKYQPRYNILLKDGKTYPSICITNEPFPRLFKTRNIIRNGSEYFGPYSSNYTLQLILEIIHELYPLRTCKYLLSDEHIKRKKYKVCLQYHIHKCKGACEGLQSADDYLTDIAEVKKIIKGDAHEISKLLLNQMNSLASEFRFEEAHRLKQKYDLIENFRSKTVIANLSVKETDVFGYDEDETTAYVILLKVNNGSIVQGKTIEYKKRLEEPREEILALAIIELREQLQSVTSNCIVPFLPDMDSGQLQFTVALRGDAKKVLDFANQNVKQYRLDKLKQAEKLNPDQRMSRILGGLQRLLHLPEMPIHIECFDNSNISGSSAVAACVVFKRAKPAKKEYRTFTIKSVEGPDDYASMREVVFRRYSRLVAEELPLPNLIIADGGVGQMEAIRKVIEDELGLIIPIIGLAKNERHKTSEIVYGSGVIQLKGTDELFKFLSFIQEEVHRFAISFHRKKRSKQQVLSELDDVPGIGEKTKLVLMQHFKSLKRAKSATFDEIENLIGTKRASIFYSYFHADLKP